MAYNNYFPATYQPNYYGYQNPYNVYPQPNPAVMQQQQSGANQNQQQTIQQSGFVLVRSEQDARAYPVAPGNSITFKDENAPFCYVKTMGFNQLDQPTFERYRLVKEDAPTEQTQTAVPATNESYALKSELESVKAELDALQAEVRTLMAKKFAKSKKDSAEVIDDE